MLRVAILILIYTSFISCTNTKNDTITIVGKVEGLPTNMVYLGDGFSIKKEKILDSAIYTNNEFIFHYTPPADFEPKAVCIRFLNREGKQQTLKVWDNFANPPHGTNAFMLEKGTTTITGKVTQIEYNFTNPMQLTTPGNETEVFYKIDIGFGSMAGTNIGNAQGRVDHYKKIIKTYPHSYFLLQRIENQKYQYTNEQLTALTAAFDASMQKSKSMASIKEYMATRPTKGKPINTEIMLANATGIMNKPIDTSYQLNMVIFWASWCKPCRQEIPMLKELYATYKDKGLHMVSISTDQKPDLWQKAMATEKMPWSQYILDDSTYKQLDTALEILAIPAVFFIDKKGTVVGTVRGNEEGNRAKFTTIIDALLKQ